MDKTMYDSAKAEELKRKKSSFTLDLSDHGRGKPVRTYGHDPREGLLTSPDVGLLKLATPELERFLLQQGTAAAAAVLTPTQILMPKPVTEEQEAYARGFVDALLNLQRQRSPLVHPAGGLICDQLGSPSFVTLTPVQIRPESLRNRPDLPAGTELPMGLATVPVMIPSAAMTVPIQNQPYATGYKPSYRSSQPSPTPPQSLNMSQESSQTVPVVDLSRVVSPVDMSNQERIKLERRREKNRCAAQKCRTRKIERIQRLEERVAELKGQNARLAQTALEQKELVARLKQQIVEHVGNGCQVMMLHDTM